MLCVWESTVGLPSTLLYYIFKYLQSETSRLTIANVGFFNMGSEF